VKAGFLDEARLEMVEAARFYELRQSGLGQSFLDAINRGVSDIESYPRRWPVVSRRMRRRLVGRFPYGLLYRIERTGIVIVAVMHLHRHPRYWIKRLRGSSDA
jgi:hypothetical protein